MMTTEAEIRARHRWCGCSTIGLPKTQADERTASGSRRESCSCGATYPYGAFCDLMLTELQQLDHDHHRMDDDGAPARDHAVLRAVGLD
jgi:hypothetical protein